MFKQTRQAVAISILGALLSACNGSGGGGDPGPDPETDKRTPLEKLALQTFGADCADFLAYTADALTEQYLTPYYCAFDGPCPIYAVDNAPPPMATPAPVGEGASADGGSPDRVSGTNTQEAGVDEPDIVKADAAGRLYVLTGQDLRIFDGYPPAGISDRPITTLALGSDDGAFYPYELLLDDAGDRLVALGASYSGNSGQAVAKVIDISTPTAPAIVRSISVDGYPLTVRSVDGRIHRVSRFDSPVPGWFYDGGDPLVTKREEYQQAQASGDEAAAAEARAAIRDEIGNRVSAAGADDFLPRQRITEAGGGITDNQLACERISHPEVTTAMGLALVDSFNIDGSGAAVSGIVNNSYLVYGSTRNLYLVQSSLGWFFAPEQVEESAIYRLALSEDGPAVYRALGKVDGSVNTSYQLSEYEGALRVSSTERRNTEQTSTTYNHVTVLDATSDNTMTRLGVINDLAEGETIQGTRFIGPRGFVVTFRQIDPLFAIDLSNPAAPVVTDELKIPGFSSYLMPLGNDTLLTIGRAGTDEGVTGGVAVQLFDVGDMSNIRQIAVNEVDAGGSGYSYSAAEYDQHAFSDFSDNANAALPGTLSIPIYTDGAYDESGGSSNSFSGFLVLRVDTGADAPLAELGRIDHGPLVDQSDDCQSPPPGSFAGSDVVVPECYFYQPSADPLRSVFLQDEAGRYLLTISSAGVIASDAAQPATAYGSQAWTSD